MARMTPRPQPTQERRLPTLYTDCPCCGRWMWFAYENRRTITALEAVLRVRLLIRRCENPSCVRYHAPYQPEAEGRLALPKHEFGLSIIAWLGTLRYREHRSVPELHRRFIEGGWRLWSGRFWCNNSRWAIIVGMTFADHLFKRRHFDRLIITLCVRWYVRYKLSYRDLVEMMAERGLSMAHTTIMRWVARFIPVFEQRWRKYSKPVGRSWRVDETYIKVKGEWVYLYRAVDKAGETVDFYLSKHRDIEAAKAFFRKAILHNGPPQKITLDGYPASHRAVEDLQNEAIIPAETVLRSCPYLNNIVEQDHRGIKSRTGPMLGFKRFDHATIVIAGIELARKIKKGQFNVHRLMKRVGDIHDLWMAVLVA